MNRRTKIAAVKYIVYSLIMLFLYVLQTDPNFFYIDYIKPVLVLPFAVCIAMFESQLVGGLFGLFAGVLCDVSSTVLFGFQSILYLCICTAVGLLVVYLMQPSMINSLLAVGLGFGARLLLEYFFYYVMWGYDNSHLILLDKMLPLLIYTLVVTPFLFLAVRKMHRFVEEKMAEN